jgi:ribosomal protein L11 methyltransferase
MDYILEITIPTGNPSLEDHVRGLLFLSASTGDILLEDDWFHVISAFFDSVEDRAAFLEEITRFEGVEVRLVDQPRQDWLDLYQQSLEPMFIGRRFVVAPERSLIEGGSGRIPIVIPQERAFGTGSHETTALCLEMIESLDLEGRLCLDVGTGSGLLGIGMVQLGAARVVVCDNDVDTLSVVGRNLERNSIERGRFQQFVGSLDAIRGERFHVTAMNIIPEVILPMLPDAVRLLEPGGSLIVSGILVVRRDEVVAAAADQGLTLQREASRGEWWCGELRLQTRR